MWFERLKVIRFHHCDPAAIIFYPQYFVLFHELMEEWFSEGLNTNYGEYIRVARLGVPAVKAECEFVAQSKLGDEVNFRLHPTRLGTPTPPRPPLAPTAQTPQLDIMPPPLRCPPLAPLGTTCQIVRTFSQSPRPS